MRARSSVSNSSASLRNASAASMRLLAGRLDGCLLARDEAELGRVKAGQFLQCAPVGR